MTEKALGGFKSYTRTVPGELEGDFFRNAFEHAAMGMAFVAPSGRLLKVNRCFSRITGYSQEELLALDFASITHSDDIDLSADYASQLLQGKIEHFQAEKRYVHKLGHTVWVLLSVALFRDDQGTPLYFISQIQDIMEWKLIQHCLKESEQRYKSLFEHHPDAVVYFDLHGNFLDVNSANEKITGHSEEELLYQSRKNFIVEEDLERAVKHFNQTIEGVPQNYEIAGIHKDGHRIELNVTSVPIVVNDQTMGVYSIVKDITEQKRTQEELRSTKELLESFIANVDDAIAITDLAGNMLRVNKAFEHIFGWAQHEIAGRILPMGNEFLEEHKYLRQKVIKGEQVVGFETVWQRKDGSLFDVSVTVSPIRDGKGAAMAFAFIGRDITARKRTEELLRKSDKLSAVGQLAAGIAHEIRNPLTALKGFVQLLQSKAIENRPYFEIMMSELERINYIVNEFMLLAKPAEAKHFQRKDIHGMIRNIVMLLETQAIISNVQIVLEFEARIPLILCDEGQLKQVFVNVIQNAIEAMPAGGNLTIEIKPKPANKVLIRFSDQGCGIPKERIPKLGEPFFSTKEKGTGLGLMICYKIIEAHQGSLQIKSKMNKGTAIDIVLPVSP